MQVTAWNNGKHHRTGAGYGLKLASSDRDRYFRKSWKHVSVSLPNGVVVSLNTDKDSFWNETCRELIGKEIGAWLIAEGLAPWRTGQPPRLELKRTGDAKFALRTFET
jgi:hypothetical protein